MLFRQVNVLVAVEDALVADWRVLFLPEQLNLMLRVLKGKLFLCLRLLRDRNQLIER